ncbi:MAG TPA: hypothetical protein VD973_05930 [Symbiobacteriaceae bacterium]|nr:hypothetical protein [Symbiobacteriaceae bacterium]
MSDSVDKRRLADRAEAILRKDRSALKKVPRQQPAVLSPADTKAPGTKLA